MSEFTSEQVEDLTQTAFSAFIDAAQDRRGHDRATVGMRAAVRSLIGPISEILNPPGIPRHRHGPAHGTYGGHQSGCRCYYCREARRIYEQAYRASRQSGRSNQVYE